MFSDKTVYGFPNVFKGEGDYLMLNRAFFWQTEKD